MLVGLDRPNVCGMVLGEHGGDSGWYSSLYDTGLLYRVSSSENVTVLANGELLSGPATGVAKAGLAGSYSCAPSRFGMTSVGQVGSYSSSFARGRGGLDVMSVSSGMCTSTGEWSSRSQPKSKPGSSVDGRVK